jgi:hypothetical protein
MGAFKNLHAGLFKEVVFPVTLTVNKYSQTFSEDAIF